MERKREERDYLQLSVNKINCY